MFRVILAFCSFCAVLYSGYWGAGRITLPRAIEAWAEDRRAEGWQVAWSDLSLRGFPSRFDTTLTEPSFADPETGWAWQGQFLQMLALSYKPNHLIAVLPPRHQLATPDTRYQIQHKDARASLVFAGGTDFRIARATSVVENLEILQTNSRISAQSIRFGLRPTSESPLSYDIGLAVEGLAPSHLLKAQLDPAEVLPPALEAVNLDAALAFDAPWDRFALETARPQPTALHIKRAEAIWGGLHLRIAADLSIDPQGFASGEITVKATNWREIIALVQNAGLIPEGAVPLLESALGSIAEMSGPPNTLDMPLNVRQGRIRLGLIPLGTLPLLRLL